MSNLSIKVTRDSVCMGDDYNAPHLLELSLPLESRFDQLFEALKKHKYLATVNGTNHSWSMKSGNQKLAHVIGNTRQPELEIATNVDISNYSFQNNVEIHFEYHSSEI